MSARTDWPEEDSIDLDVKRNGAAEERKAFLEALEARAYDPNLNPPPIQPVYSLGEIPVSTPGNLTTIIAASKTGKTAFLSAMIASVVKPDGVEVDTLGIVGVENPKGLALLHFDTEQSTDDHWRILGRAKRRADVQDFPLWCRSFCLTGYDAMKAKGCVCCGIEDYAERLGGIHSILIDGWADLVLDVNDAAESNSFVARFHDIAIKYRCPIIGILHLNPGTEKARGHLGSQLERKSESNLKLDKDGNVTEVWSDKQRRAPIIKGHGPRFRWDTISEMHVSIETGHSERDRIARASAQNVVGDVFRDHPAMRWIDLNKALISHKLAKDSKAAEKIIAKWKELGVVEIIAGLYSPRPCK